MSIKPEFVNRIMTRQKEYEFRRKVCKKEINKIYIYSTAPVQKVVGEAEVEDILICTPSQLWAITKDKAGIDKPFFDRYFENREEAVAYKLSNIVQYELPKSLVEFGIKSAPQSYQYID